MGNVVLKGIDGGIGTGQPGIVDGASVTSKGVVDNHSEVSEGIEASASSDTFDLSRLTIRQDFLETANVKKLLTVIPVCRPGGQDFVRVNPLPEYRATVALLELKEDRDIYVVSLQDVPLVQGECYAATLFTAITRTGTLFFWPVRIPAADGRPNDWHVSAMEAANLAMTKWIRMKANMSLRAYDIYPAEGLIPDPVWSDLSFIQLCKIAFRDKLISSYDHPVLKRLRGG